MDLSDLFLTRAQALDFANKLSNIIDKIYTTNFNLENELLNQFGIEKRDIFMRFIHSNKIVDTSPEKTEEFLKKIKETIDTLPVVTLTLAFEAQQDTLKAFSQWFMFSVNKQVIFDIKTDASLIAGANITYNGKFKDYSIRTFFNEIVQKSLTPQGPKPAVHQSTEHMEIGR